MIHAVGTLAGQPQFQRGVAAGLAGLVMTVVLSLVWRRRAPGTPLPAGGLLVAAAMVVGLGGSAMREDLTVGLLLLAGIVALTSLVRHRWLAAVASVPGSIVVAVASTRPPSSVPWVAVAAGIVLLGALVADFDMRRRRTGLGPVLLAVSAAGVYVTVPDTEAAAALLGAALAMAPAGWPWSLTSLGRAGSYVAVGALLAVAADGGRSLGTSVMGGAACLGLLAAEPLAAACVAARRGRPAARRHRSGWATIPFLLAHGGVVAIASRIAGQTSSPGVALAVVVADVVLAVALAVGLSRTEEAWRPRVGGTTS